MRRFPLATLLGLALVLALAAACAEGSGPVSLEGRYTLRSFDGHALPVDQGGGSLLNRGRLTLTHGGDFSLLLELEDETGVERYTAAGTYRRRHGRLAFDGIDSDSEPIAFDARAGADRLTVTVDSVPLVFVK